MNADIPLHDEEFLKLAKEAGCIAIWIGFESLSQKTIDVMGKKTNTVQLYKEIIRKIHDHGILVSGIFVFGFDTDTKDVFDETLQCLSSLDIDFPRFAILTPYPGTPLYEELEKEQRILTRDWSKYDTNHVVFQPKQMSPDDLESEYLRLYGEVYAPSNVVKRIIRIPNQTFSSRILNAISNIQSWRYFTTC